MLNIEVVHLRPEREPTLYLANSEHAVQEEYKPPSRDFREVLCCQSRGSLQEDYVRVLRAWFVSGRDVTLRRLPVRTTAIVPEINDVSSECFETLQEAWRRHFKSSPKENEAAATNTRLINVITDAAYSSYRSGWTHPDDAFKPAHVASYRRPTTHRTCAPHILRFFLLFYEAAEPTEQRPARRSLLRHVGSRIPLPNEEGGGGWRQSPPSCLRLLMQKGQHILQYHILKCNTVGSDWPPY